MNRKLILWLVIPIFLVSAYFLLSSLSNSDHHQEHVEKLAYADFLEKVKNDEIASVIVNQQTINSITKDHQHLTTTMPANDDSLIGELVNHKVIVTAHGPEQQNLLLSIFIAWVPFMLGMIYVAVSIWILIFFICTLRSINNNVITIKETLEKNPSLK